MDILKKIKEPKSDKDKVKISGELLNGLQTISKLRSESWFYEGYYLYWLKANDLWKYTYGNGVGSWTGFLSSLNIDQSTTYQKFNAYEFFIIRHGFLLKDVINIDVKKIRTIITYAKTKPKKDIEDLLTQAKELSWSDFMTEITNKEMCHHLNYENKEESILICKDCGKKIKNKE